MDGASTSEPAPAPEPTPVPWAFQAAIVMPVFAVLIFFALRFWRPREDDPSS